MTVQTLNVKIKQTKEKYKIYIPLYNDLDFIAVQGAIGYEIFKQSKGLDAIIAFLGWWRFNLGCVKIFKINMA